VEAAAFRSYAPGDPGFELSAGAYALCLGGLENPRFLLNCTAQRPAGIGNEHDLVGRYFCEHLHMALGDAVLEEPMAEATFFAPTPAFLAEHGVLNFKIEVRPLDLPVPPLGTALAQSVRCFEPFAERLAAAVFDAEGSCRPGRGFGTYVARRFIEPGTRARLEIASEQVLQRDSRVMLAGTTDAFGLRRIRFDWRRMNEADHATLRTAVDSFARAMAAAGLGRFRPRDWLRDPATMPRAGETDGQEGLWHHMCATRMADDPREGVVDRDCRVHGLANLYVGGSSVFATPGHTYPTYSIVQLALRLGDHIAQELLP
jgi:choline dehydrogenase-like flavoprotein